MAKKNYIIQSDNELIANSSETNQKNKKAEEKPAVLIEDLKKKVRIFCFILTSPKYLSERALAVNLTWAKRCNKYLFMTGQNVSNTTLPVFGLNVTEKYEYLWQKTKASLNYLYHHYLNDYDFFIKADDDTYLIVENLRFMLKDVNPNSPIYFGRHFRPIVKQGYASGGAGYVLSREALRRFVKYGLDKHKDCFGGNDGFEDANMGKCLEAVNVTIGDSRDDIGRERFHPLAPRAHFDNNLKSQVPWLFQYNFYPVLTGVQCCSKYSISFHYIDPKTMYLLDFLIYDLTPHGLS